jgi:hypothetical protein
VLPWPHAKELFPAVMIEGEPVPDDPSYPVRTAEDAKFRARLWVRKVAFEVAKDLPEGEREACELFVLKG